MPASSYAHWMLDQEAHALLARLARVKPFVLSEPMVLAASLLPAAQIAIERFLTKGRRELRERIQGYLSWMHGEGKQAPPDEIQRRFVFLKLRFNAVLAQLELFYQVISQRSESEQGVWISGLDVVAADALALPEFYEAPPVICYLDRGIGGAIRRARTRMPGGGENPVAVIRIPRERMIGSGIASSLVHETGHQAAALLGLVPSLQQVLQDKQRAVQQPMPWRLWERWISEIVADCWSVARVGVVSTLGLIGVVSLPRPFVFRINVDDPHPAPWIRVKLSCAIGDGLYPHPQWKRIADLWEILLPPRRPGRRAQEAARATPADPRGIRDDHDRSPPASPARPFAQGSHESRGANACPARGALQRLEQGAAADVPRVAVARVRGLGPGKGGWRPQPQRRKRSPGEASHLLGDAQHARRLRLLRGNPEIESASTSSLDNLERRRDDNGKTTTPQPDHRS